MQRTEQKVMHAAAVAKSHLVLGGMDIDIHLSGIQLHKQGVGGMAVVVEHVPVGLAHRVGHHLVANHPAIDKKVL